MSEADTHTNVAEVVGKLNTAFAEFKAQHNERLTAAEKAIDDANVKLAAAEMRPGQPRAQVNPMATILAHSDALKALREGQTRAVTIPTGVAIKAALVGDGNAPYGTPPTQAPGIFGIGQRALTLLDVLPSMAVTGSSFQFNQVTSSYANAAGYQATQGGDKPAQSFPLAITTANIATIAAVAAASEQVLSDEPSLQARVGDLLRYGVRAKLEAELVGGAGGAGKIGGLTKLGTAFAQTENASTIDAISECIAHLAAIGWNPSAVVMNPADWHAVRISKASSSGVYLSGTFDQPAAPNAWGVPVVQSAALAAGSAIVMDASQAVLLDRQSVTVDIGRMGDDFGQNVLRIRCELRAGLAVFAPTAVQLITL